jgi:hypothetical protein
MTRHARFADMWVHPEEELTRKIKYYLEKLLD